MGGVKLGIHGNTMWYGRWHFIQRDGFGRISDICLGPFYWTRAGGLRLTGLRQIPAIHESLRLR